MAQFKLGEGEGGSGGMLPQERFTVSLVHFQTKNGYLTAYMKCQLRMLAE